MNKFLWAAFATIAASIGYGQATTSTISGEVRDPTGAAIAGAVVTTRNTGTSLTRTTLTSESGQYNMPLLPPGDYEVTVEAPGFRRWRQGGLILKVSEESRVDARLELGAVADTVDVQAEILQTATESAVNGSVIDNRKVVELPLNSREFYGLALLVPGAYAPAQNSTVGYRGGFNVAGATETSNNFSVNGIDNNDTGINGPAFRPSVDSIQEFKLLTGIVPAEYGRSSGGQVVVITKSGTNQFHGNMFEFLRNQAMDARNYFSRPTDARGYKRNQFGGTFGGPIVRDKTFFFGSYEGLRLRQQISALATVPLEEMRNGDFRSLLSLPRPIRVVNPLTGADFSVPNVVDPALIDPTGKQLMGFYPLPTLRTSLGSAPASNYNFNAVRRESMNQGSVKVDHTFSQKDSAFANFNIFDDPSFEPSNSLCGSSVLPGFGCDSVIKSQLGALSEIHVFTPTLLNEARVGYNVLENPRLQEDVNANFPGLPGAVSGYVANNTGLPSTSVTGYSRLGGAGNLPSTRVDVTYQVTDTLSWTRGRHAMKFGGEYRKFLSTNIQGSGARGSVNFTGATTAYTSGYPLADLLLGYPTSTSRNPNQGYFYNRMKTAAFFVQDDFKVTSRLTLNLGLRWELNAPIKEKYDRMSSFDPVTGTMRVLGQNGVGRNLYNTDWNNFAPRFGFAWQPFGNPNTVIRAGYGMFYNIMTTLNGFYNLTQNPPFRNPQTFNSSRAIPVTFTNPFPSGLGAGSNTAFGIDQNFPVAFRHQWSFGIQRQITSGILLDLTYFAAKGVHLPRSLNVNQPLPGPGTTAQVNARRPYPTFGNITFFSDVANSNYHSLQAKLEARMSKGLTTMVSYTLGKSIDDSPGLGSTSSASSGAPQNSRDTRSERGLSDFDVRHRLVWNNVWEIPFNGRNAVSKAVLSGWQISNIFTIQTGRPFTPTIGGNRSNTFGNADRPNVIGDPNAGEGIETPRRWFNTAAFAAPALGTFGNAGRNILTGPGLVNLDVTLSRTFKFGERARLQFRAEAFNLMNHPNFNYPNAAFDNPSFGIITSAADPRQIQLGLKLAF